MVLRRVESVVWVRGLVRRWIRRCPLELVEAREPTDGNRLSESSAVGSLNVSSMSGKLSGAALTSHQTKTCPAPPAPKGNTRAAKHGAKSQTKLAPVRETHLQVLR